MDTQTNSPIPISQLISLCNTACDSALSTASLYSHSSTATWNNDIISSILKSLISETETEKPGSKYKWAVNSTIIQHLSDAGQSGEDVGGEKKVGRRGMHSASAAYWNNEKDGMWSFKYEGAVEKGMDVMISVIWMAA